MRCITYAGETVTTTDDVAEALIDLTAAVARAGRAEAVEIPIVDEDSGKEAVAELVIGVGNDVLSVPMSFEGEEPDFSAVAGKLQERLAAFEANESTPPAPHARISQPEDLDDFDSTTLS